MFPSVDCRAGLCDGGYQELQLLLYVPYGSGYILIQQESIIKYGVPVTDGTANFPSKDAKKPFIFLLF